MTIKKVTCYGTGLIGSGWATNFIMAGLDTVLYDIDNEKINFSKNLIENNLKFLVEQGTLAQEQVDDNLKRLTFTTDPKEAVKGADFVQENGPENLNLKQLIVAEIESNCRPDTIIASSTSGFNISDIAKNAVHPERFVGGHPYNPVHLVPLVEMTRSENTDEKVLSDAYEFYLSINKEPIILKKEALGFISNRLQVALYREAVDLVCRGVCSMEEVDRAVCYGPGLRYALMGPNTLYQLGGGTHGIGGMLKHIGAVVPLWLKDMAGWTEWPEGFIDGAQAQMDEEMKIRDELHGKTNEEMAKFRDKGLVKLLQYHGKL